MGVWLSGRGAVATPGPEALAAAVLLRNVPTAGQHFVVKLPALYFGVGLP